MWTFFTRFRFSGKPRTVLGIGKDGPLCRGFTIVELLVVLGIITILSTVFLFQQRRFDSSTLLRSLAYSIALSVRQAQTYGSSVRQFGATAQSFTYSYGVYFSNGASSYQLFADANSPQNQKYDSSPIDEKVQSFTIGNGYTIFQFCAELNNGSLHCSTDSGGITWISIYFKRPNPDACFATSLNPGGCATYKSAYIRISGPAAGTADSRRITITSTGQITVGNLGS